MPDVLLAFNAGSSSLKLALFEAATPEKMASGQIEGLGRAPRLAMTDADGRPLAERSWPEGTGMEALFPDLLGWADAQARGGRLAAAGHRIVHGGPDFTDPVRLDGATIRAVRALTPLDPLHQPASLAPIEAIAAARPDLAQVGCFDTAFHHAMGPPANRFAIPRAIEAKGVRRYGFHGLSFEYIARRLRETAPELAEGRVVVAHLGSGASLCALRAGRSVDTTMGFTSLDGLVMGTRPGSIDPGVLLYLQRTEGLSLAEVEHMLYRESGLLGVSGLSADLRDLLRSGEPQAAAAVDLFTFSVARHVAALACTLEGLDGLVFTGGIGENMAEVRAAICGRLRWIGAALDGRANAAGEARIGGTESRIDLRVIATDEAWMIAHHTRRVLELG